MPPITAAPTAYSSVCAPPVVGLTELSRLAIRMPATTASVEHRMKQTVLMFGDPDAGAPRRLGVAADGVDVAAEAGPRQQERQPDHEHPTNGTTHGTPWIVIGAFGRWRS